MMRLSNLPFRCITSGYYEERLQSCVWSAAWLRQAEEEAAREHKITLYDLMQRAGKAAFGVFRREYPSSRHWLILCGSGNNGGDGFEVARLAADDKLRVTVLAVKGTKPLPPEASAAHAALLKRGDVKIHDADQWKETDLAEDVDLVVDGLLGTGITGAPRADYARLIDLANALPVPCVSIDIPSGLNAETGAVEGVCVRAEHTVTFIALKPGLITGQARNYTGTLHYDCLQLGEWMLDPKRQSQLFCRRIVSSHLKTIFAQTPSPCAHKGSNGRLLLVGGDHKFGGAIIMAAEAALNTGVGLVRVVTRSAHIGPLLSRCPEVMAYDCEKCNMYDLIQWSTCVAVGPGIGQNEWGEDVVFQIIYNREYLEEKSFLLDADAINLFSKMVSSGRIKESGLIERKNKKTVITPHPGEAARLLQCTIEEVEKDRFQAAKKLADLYGFTVLLKGPGTVICAAEDGDISVDALNTAHGILSSRCVVSDAGNSGMATGGFGDVLTGVISGFLAQGFSVWQATCGGCLAHSTAADLAAAAQGSVRGLRATTLFEHILTCVNPLTERQCVSLKTGSNIDDCDGRGEPQGSGKKSKVEKSEK
ncbi:protein kinase, putative [Trypanosoma cruzi]|nr:protein kinase, putative [Trypanosoma cruzi]